MAAAALGRARRRRQNGRSSRTCNRVPSSPLRAGTPPTASVGPGDVGVHLAGEENPLMLALQTPEGERKRGLIQP
ncbi:hypothetical protein CapIbe_011934 [Capra ibex]